MKKQLLKKLFAFIISIMMFSASPEFTNAQRNCNNHCPKGYTCVNGSCEPTGYSCNCAYKNYGCKTAECKAACTPVCSFLSEENNELPVITISSNSDPRLITINFTLEEAAIISIKIYDVSGRLIKTLADEKMEPASHQVEWNEQDEQGKAADAGIYIVQFDTPNKSETKKLSVIN